MFKRNDFLGNLNNQNSYQTYILQTSEAHTMKKKVDFGPKKLNLHLMNSFFMIK